MLDDSTYSAISQVGRLVTSLLSSRSIQTLAELWKLWRKITRSLAEEGMYEVLEYEGTLELLDPRGETAQFQKRERVRYLQNETIAYQDQAWGDGKILLDYQCSPGTPVDRYRPGQKTYVLISLRDVKRRGDVDEFHIQWRLRDAFLRSRELLETEVSHRTRKLRVQLIFPAGRPPQRIVLREGRRPTAQPLPPEALLRLPDGRWRVLWEKAKPRLHERYTLQWDW
jgi:hypothetical protein